MLHILKADSVRRSSLEVEGDYEVLYTKLLRNGGYSGPIKHYETRWRDEYPERVDRGDTVLVSGSTLDAFANDDFTNKLVAFVQAQLLQDDVRLIGICYGHQVIARALGSRVSRASYYELGVIDLHLTTLGRQVFPEFEKGSKLIQAHRDVVQGLPKNAQLLAYSANCEVQSFCVPNKVLCIQGHPEFTKITLRAIIETTTDSEAAERATRSLDSPYSNSQLSFGLAKFVLRR